MNSLSELTTVLKEMFPVTEVSDSELKVHLRNNYQVVITEGWMGFEIEVNYAGKYIENMFSYKTRNMKNLMNTVLFADRLEG